MENNLGIFMIKIVIYLILLYEIKFGHDAIQLFENDLNGDKLLLISEQIIMIELFEVVLKVII
jgi:hypothetical protein